MHFARDSNAIEEHTRNRYLELSMSSKPSKVGRTQAFIAGNEIRRGSLVRRVGALTLTRKINLCVTDALALGTSGKSARRG